MPSGWRIADPVFSKTPQEMLSGEGARLYGGRWNSKGNSVVYLGGNLATAAMELLVHLKSARALSSYSKMEVSFDESRIIYIDPDELPNDWTEPTMESTIQFIGDDWITKQESLILQVPSVVVHGETNFLLNPAHPDYSSIETSEITDFTYDPRIR